MTIPVEAAQSETTAMLLAVSRSAAVRLASVAAELGDAQTLVGLAPGAADGGPPRTVPASLGPVAVASAVEDALRARPDIVVIAGDGEAAVSAALVAARAGVAIAHVGAGLRCDDRGIDGEINRLVLDELADRLYADSEDAVERLRAEGFAEERIVLVGSTLPDAVARWIGAATERAAWATLGLASREYVLATLHKRENIGDDVRLARIADGLSALARDAPVVLCLHPHTRARLERGRDLQRLRSAGVILVDALGYLDFLSLQARAGAVLTDSAGVQEETTLLGVPCFTLARASERALTLTHGTNVLLGDDPADIADVRVGAFAGPVAPIPLWDGGAGRRIAADLRAGAWRRA
jgi:UDP-N-acetylglucosamine 2-epimerase (non-hydrolysing)